MWKLFYRMCKLWWDHTTLFACWDFESRKRAKSVYPHDHAVQYPRKCLLWLLGKRHCKRVYTDWSVFLKGRASKKYCANEVSLDMIFQSQNVLKNWSFWKFVLKKKIGPLRLKREKTFEKLQFEISSAFIHTSPKFLTAVGVVYAPPAQYRFYQARLNPEMRPK